MIQEIIFDCFGVLTHDGWKAFMAEHASAEDEERLHALNHSVDAGRIPFQVFLDEVARVTSVSEETIRKFLITGYVPDRAMFRFIAALKDAGYKVSLLSNVGSPMSDYLPPELLSVFDVQTLSYQEKSAKPEPAIFNNHLKKTGTPPEHAVFIDDRESNCDGARAVGMHAIYYQGLAKLKNELAELGVSVSDN